MGRNTAQRLCEAIIRQAVEDYRELKRRKLSWIGSDADGNFSMTEIEHFLRSDWCRRLLCGIDSRLDGTSILRQLKSENA